MNAFALVAEIYTKSRAKLRASLEKLIGGPAVIVAGDRRDVPLDTFVRIAQDVERAETRCAAGDYCYLIKGGNVIALGTSVWYGVLVKYEAPPWWATRDRHGKPNCPDQALVFLWADDLAKWPAYGTVSLEAEKERSDLAAEVGRLTATYS